MSATGDGDRGRPARKGSQRFLDLFRPDRHPDLNTRWAKPRHPLRPPTWLGEPSTCGLCGRRLLAGERLQSYEHPDGVIDACPLCAIELDGAGLRSLSQTGPDNDEPEGAAA